MQASLAAISAALGLLAAWIAGDWRCIVGAVLIFANWPYTLFGIMPTNNRLKAMAEIDAGPASRSMLVSWGRLHAVRTMLGFAASGAANLSPNARLRAAPTLAHGINGVTVMGYRIFLAGASGAIGRRLTPLLHGAGHYVCGSTRSEANADALRALGADPVVVDVFDAPALSRAVASARPDVVIHQLTDLPKDLNPREMGAAIVRTARIRSEGTRNLVRAAICGGCAPIGGAKHRMGLRAGGRAARGDRPARYRGRGRERYQHAGSNLAGRSHFKIRRRSRASSFATASFMAPELLRTGPQTLRPFMWMRRPMPLCSPSTTATLASTTSRSPTDTIRPKRHARSWVGLSDFRLPA